MEVGIERVIMSTNFIGFVVYINTQLYFLFFHFKIDFLVNNLGIFIQKL